MTKKPRLTRVRLLMLGICLVLLVLTGPAWINFGGLRPDQGSPALAAKTSIYAPEDFILLPCFSSAKTKPETDCVIIAAGGKRVLIGAPAGIGSGIARGDIFPPDRVLLFSLKAAQIEGLDELRNRFWARDIGAPIKIGASEEIVALIGHLNAAYTASDALAYLQGVEGTRLNTMPIEAFTLGVGDIAFDTGDLRLQVLTGGPNQFAYLVSYADRRVLVAPCGAPAETLSRWPKSDLYLGCAGPGPESQKRLSWPLQTAIYID